MSDKNVLAFEYALGTLRGDEKKKFEQRMRDDAQLQSELDRWNEQLMTMQRPFEIMPKRETWEGIRHRIDTQSSKQILCWRKILWWLLSPAIALSFIVIAHFQSAPPIAYLAILNDDLGAAQVTVLSDEQGESIRFNWHIEQQIPAEQDLQVWAKSKRDGEIRSLFVLENAGDQQYTLDNAQWRLIQDAHSLILSVEEKGGSAIAEPSEELIASGVCVRLNTNSDS